VLVDVPDVMIKTLAAFLRTAIPALTVLEEFPYANQQLKYPSLTISSNKPERTPEMPYQVSQTQPDSKNMVVANEVVAHWEDTLQLDLWARDKGERANYTACIVKLFATATANQIDGLTLPMPLHFNEPCRYEIDTIECKDDEAAAQRQERRELIKVLVNCNEIVQRSYYAMIKVQVAVGTDDSDDTETTTF
jgi:hypothetical protein